MNVLTTFSMWSRLTVDGTAASCLLMLRSMATRVVIGDRFAAPAWAWCQSHQEGVRWSSSCALAFRIEPPAPSPEVSMQARFLGQQERLGLVPKMFENGAVV